MAEERHCSECGGKLPADAPQGMCPQCLMKLGLPTGAETEKAGPKDEGSDVPTTGTPPGRFVPPEPSELVKQFPQLEILELLGQGGMGAVYKARQKQLDRVVALKILPAFTERFMREARSMAKLHNPRIVSVFDFGQTKENLYYFIMEFVDGTDLRHVIRAGGLSPQEALALVPQICEALQFAHEEGIVHRDIKPENILIDKKGRVKISDFGLAKLLDKPATAYTLTDAGHTMGTPHYMAPEQIEHPGQVDHRADIYSLGVVFYEMLTGELPIGRFAPPSQKVQVDVRLDNVVLRTLEKEPERRYQHASEVKTDVETIKADTVGPQAPIAPAGQALIPVPAINRMEKHITIVAVLSLVFGTIGILVGIAAFVAISGGGLISQDPTAMNVTGIVGTGVFGFFLLMWGPEVIAGIGLLKRRNWARILGLILAIPDLMIVPIGTAIGIYAIWVLLNDETFKLFAQASEIRKKEQAAGIKPGPTNIILPTIAITVAILFLIVVGITILLGAFPWFAIVFGPPLLIFVVLALWQAKGRPATGAAGQRPKTDRRAVFTGLVIAVIALILMAIMILPALLPALYLARSRHVSTPQEETVEIAPGIQKIGELAFAYGNPNDLTFGPEGPTLNDTCVLKLNLEPQEATSVNSILQAAHKRYQELKARYTEQLRSGNSLKVTISPFREDADSFLRQLWAELDNTLDEEQHDLAREHLPLGQLLGKYQFGQTTVIFMITKENGTFSHTTTVEWPDRSHVGSGGGKTLPPELQRYWDQAATDE
ncbi:MAG: bifunctional serine/threonine protein kinase/MFS transporter [Planctomycetota bacterium]